MKGQFRYLMATAMAGVLVAGCGNGEEASSPGRVEEMSAVSGVKSTDWPMSDDPVLSRGRAVWVENCENCHGIGKAGSPRFGDLEAWAPRLAKGTDALIDSALNGFEGKSEGGMPARGGEEELSDGEVTAAVKYMIHFSGRL